ncbi:hypothetical protein [Paenibacillus campi]|uniref:hypothetical protein n=1 Tax=Paenibacillus campi TaxID=3106031 RepID=UPI002AFDDA50|nr:hypothetical protein [Paenibacillus sp. SGZ-1014]
MKLHDWLKSASRSVRTHTTVTVGVTALLLGSIVLLIMSIVVKPQQDVASNSSNASPVSIASAAMGDKSISTATAPASVQLPTGTAIPVETLPDPAQTAIVSYPVGKLVSNEPGGKRPVTLAVERQVNADQWLGDKLVFGAKESALTVDMLRKDGGNMGVYYMPAAKPVDVADLYFTVTHAGSEMLAGSDYGLIVQALYGELMIPAEAVKALTDRDMNVQLHTDHTLSKPEGAQSTSMQVTVENGVGKMYVTLPIENSELTAKQLQQLRVQLQTAAGQQQAIDSTLVDYNASSSYSHGLRFRVVASGTYTIVLPE